MNIGILKNEISDSVEAWVKACENKDISYKVIDLTKNSWLDEIISQQFDLFVLRPTCSNQDFKTMYDERIYILAKVLEKNIFPSYEECYIYENKRLLSYYLKALNIPHPRTDVFYNYAEAEKFTRETTYPIVAKTNIGAAGSGVKVLNSKEEANKYIKKAFKGGGIRRRFGPNRVTGSPKKWFVKALKDPDYFIMKLKSYLRRYEDTQKGLVIFQKFVPHDFEWRVIKIGNSFFGYKKLAYKGKASGVKKKEFVDPPKQLLDFVREISEKHNFQSMAFDIFEHPEQGYLVNELQTIWGNKPDPKTGSYYRLAVNGVPGRYVFNKKEWKFEAGDFNTNESCDLRLEAAIKLFNLKK